MNRTSLLGLSDCPVEAVPCPEWGGDCVYVRCMNGHQRSKWSDLTFDDEGHVRENPVARLLVCTLCDADGNLMFAPTEDDANLLAEKRGDVLIRIWLVAKRLNGLDSASREKTEKNS